MRFSIQDDRIVVTHSVFKRGPQPERTCMSSTNWINHHLIKAVCGVSMCVTVSACSGDIETSAEGSAWELEEWTLTDPGPDPRDMGPREDMEPTIIEPEDFGPPPRDFGPIRDLPLPFDAGVPDFGEPDFGEPDFGEPDIGEPDLGSMLLPTGAPCRRGDECTGGRCLPERRGWQEGYCTEDACDISQCAGTGGECVRDDVLNNSFCAQPCNPNPAPGFESCREGYECRDSDSFPGGPTYCLPPRAEPPPVGVADGEACTGPQDCQGGTCIAESEGWPGGYCTSINCNNRNDCASPGGEDNRCYQNPQGPNICVRICQDTSECRQDYVCQPVGGGVGFCVPDPSTPVEIDFSTYPIPVTCGPTTNPAQQRHTVNFSVDPSSTSYMITTLARDGRQIASERTDAPVGSINYFQGNNSYQNTTAQLFGFVSPIPTPAQPEFASQFESGMHTHTLYSESQDVCHYFLEESTPGTTIDLNIYLVGVPGITSANAATDPNLQQTLTSFSTIYGAANISLGTVRYFDITGADLQSYRVVRSEDDIAELVALSGVPGNTVDDALSLNVFFVQAIALGGGTIGISQGLPGPAGIHGSRASGVVFTSEFLGVTFNDGSGPVNGNDYTGIVLAHEIGHYIGLFHTTEQGGRGQDPLTDTPVCRRNQFPSSCPDLGNLMFPFADITHTGLTADQSFVIGVNPLTKD